MLDRCMRVLCVWTMIDWLCSGVFIRAHTLLCLLRLWHKFLRECQRARQHLFLWNTEIYVIKSSFQRCESISLLWLCLVTELQYLQSSHPRRSDQRRRWRGGRPATGQEKELRWSPEKWHPVWEVPFSFHVAHSPKYRWIMYQVKQP